MLLEGKVQHHGTSTVNDSFVLLVVRSMHSLQISLNNANGWENKFRRRNKRENTPGRVGKEAGGGGIEALPAI